MAIKIPSLQERALPSSAGTGTPGAGAFGVGVGNELQRTGDVLGKIGIDIKNREDEAAAREVDTWMHQQLNAAEVEYGQLSGREAYDGYKDYQSRTDAIRKDAEARLGNEQQRRMFAPIADRRMTEKLNSGSRHAAGQLRAWEVSALESQAELNAQDMTTYIDDPNQFQTALGSMFENLEDLGAKKGWSPDEVTVRKQALTSGAIATAITGRMVADPAGAKGLMDRYGELLTPKDKAAVTAKVDAHVNKARAFNTADSIAREIEQLPEEDRKAAMLDRLRGLPPEIRDEARREVDFQLTVRKQADDESYKREVNDTWDSLLSNPTPQNIPPEGVLRDAKDRRAMISYVDAYVKHGGDIPDDPDVRYMLKRAAGNPATVREFAYTDLRQYRGQLSKSTFEKMETLQMSALASLGKADARSDTNIIGEHQTLRQTQTNARIAAGFKANTPEAVEFEDSLAAYIDQRQSEEGRKLTTQEKQEAAALFTHKVVTERSFWIDSETPQAKMKIERDDGTPFSAAEKASAIKRLKSAGMPITRTNLEKVLRGTVDRKNTQ